MLIDGFLLARYTISNLHPLLRKRFLMSFFCDTRFEKIGMPGTGKVSFSRQLTVTEQRRYPDEAPGDG